MSSATRPGRALSDEVALDPRPEDRRLEPRHGDARRDGGRGQLRASSVDSAMRGACHPKSTSGEPRDELSPVRAKASSSTPDRRPHGVGLRAVDRRGGIHVQDADDPGAGRSAAPRARRRRRAPLRGSGDPRPRPARGSARRRRRPNRSGPRRPRCRRAPATGPDPRGIGAPRRARRRRSAGIRSSR